LIGILVREDGKEKYIPFVAHKVKDEGKMFKAFLKEIDKHDDFVVYHWHNYEKMHIKQLMERHGVSAKLRKKLDASMIDLFKIATKAVAYPTYGNGLKEVAKFMGFKWEHEDIDALDAIAYYWEYAQDNKKFKKVFDKIVDYNRNDCEATRVVKDWLGKV